MIVIPIQSLEDLTQGMNADTLFGEKNLSVWRAKIGEQRKKYEALELEANLGPEPTKTDFTAGEQEMYQIKKDSRFAHGRVVVQNKTKGIQVLSITNHDGEESEYYLTHWKRQNMNRKLEILKEDLSILGACFLSITKNPFTGNWDYDVKSPKNVSVFSTDFVNHVWGDFAVEEFRNGGKQYVRYYNNKYIITFVQNDQNYTLVDAEEHNFQECPVVIGFKKINSSGIYTGDIELIIPVLNTLRQRTNATSQAVYWTGTRTLVVENMDSDDVRTDPVTGEEYNPVDRLRENIRMTASGVIFLPTGDGVSNPTLKQTEEGNVVQLVEAKKDTLRDLASITNLPYSVVDPTAIPTTNEASIQAYMNANDDKELVKANLGYLLEMVITQAIFADSGEYVELNIVWAVSEQVSINTLADTISKLAASGVPLTWIVRNVLAGYRPGQITELLNELESRNALQADQMNMIAGLTA